MNGRRYYLALFLLLVGLGGCSIGQPPAYKGGSPTVVATVTGGSPTAVATVTGGSPTAVVTAPGGSLEQCAMSNATRFYQDIGRHQLKQAYGYIDGRGKTEEGQQLSYATFTQQVRMGGTSQGTFSIDIGGYQAGINEVTMTITNHQFRYHSHLRFRQEGNTCKIIMLDRV